MDTQWSDNRRDVGMPWDGTQWATSGEDNLVLGVDNLVLGAYNLTLELPEA